MCNMDGYKGLSRETVKTMGLRKWMRADFVALAELIESYEDTGRLTMDPIPYPLDDEVARFNLQAGYGPGDGRNARGIREQIRRARDNCRRPEVPQAVRDSVKSFKSREEKEAYAQAAALFEEASEVNEGTRKRAREEAFAESEGDTEEVRALKRKLVEQGRQLSELQRENESTGLAVFRQLKDSVRLSESSLTDVETMCLSLMFFNKHHRYADPGRTECVLKLQDLRPFVGEDGPLVGEALRELGERLYPMCEKILSWSAVVCIQFPCTRARFVAEGVLGPADLAKLVGQKRTVSVNLSVEGAPAPPVDVDIDVGHMCLAHRIVTMGLKLLESEPALYGEIRAAAFDSARLKRVGWTTVIPRGLLVCENFVPETPPL